MHRFKSTYILAMFFILSLLVGCNGVPEDAINKNLEGNSELSSLEITPSLIFLYVNQTHQFIASGGFPPYVFSLLSGSGSMSPSGLYTAPGVKGQSTVRVTDSKGTTRDALISVEVQIAITPVSQKLNVNSTFQFLTTGGTAPYIYTITSGNSTVSASGTVTGAALPETAILRVTDALGYYAEATVDVGNGPIISPKLANSPISANYQFSASSGTLPFTWTVLTGDGSINSTGLYTASMTPGTYTVRVMDANGFYSDASINNFIRNQIGVGEYHSCFLLGDTQSIKCIGSRVSGATGDQKYVIGDEPSDMGENTPTPKLIENTFATPLSFASTTYNSCAIFDDGLTRCWGYSANGESAGTTIGTGLFSGDTAAYSFPVAADIGNPIVALASKGNAGNHQCGLYQDGGVKCWGSNAYGQLGQNNTLNYGSNYTSLSLYSASPIALGQGAVKVETGTSHTCAILEDGNMKCWGYNLYGQTGIPRITTPEDDRIGNEPGEMESIPLIDFTEDIVDIALSGYSTCALTSNGKVTCWGYNTYGNLGQGNTAHWGDGALEHPTSLAPINLGTGRTALKIDAGHHHTCALLDNQTMKCWGYNLYGVLGEENTSNRGDGPNEMGNNLATVYLGPAALVEDIFVGGYNTCALLTTKEIKCWGWNAYGQLGLGINADTNIGDGVDEMGPNLNSIDLGTGVTEVHHMAMRDYANCALITKNSVKTIKCWGTNSNGALGSENSSIGDEISDMGANLISINLGTTKPIAELTAGSSNSCVRFTDGSAKCWGNNTYNLLGTNGVGGATVGESAKSMGTNLLYMTAGSGVSVSKIFNGTYANIINCGIFQSASLTNALKCWGYGLYGQLGNDASTAYYIPSIPPINLGAGRHAIDVGVGYYRVCAVLDNGKVKCWGYNHLGQLGIGHMLNRGGTPGDMAALPEVQLGTGFAADQVCTGIYHNCAKDAAGKVKCWGYNAYGQLGIGDNVNRGGAPAEMGDALPYVNVGTGRSVKKLTCGNYSTCAILDNDKVKCWGYNHIGQLGQGTTLAMGTSPSSMGTNLPYTNLGAGRTALDIKSSGYSTCAVLDNNKIKCWGQNTYGNLGQGTTSPIGTTLSSMGDNLFPINLE